jgi:protein-S-isoprenylcysteine O-methyltransferase Ste14
MKRDIQHRWRGLVAGLILVPILFVVVFSRPLIVRDSWLACGLDILGYMTFLIGAIFRFWSTLYIGGRKERAVICEGAYSVCRNPLYVGSFFLALSVGFFATSVIFALGLGFTILFYMLATIPSEEKTLRGIFGEPYEEYCRKVPRFWPRFSLFHTAPVVEVNVNGLRMEFKRMLLWIWIPAMAGVLSQLRNEPWWPHWFMLP